MMGESRVGQEALFYEFSLERHVPADHLLRPIDRFVDLSGVRAHLRPFYSEIGRPSIDPELMIRMLLVGEPGPCDTPRLLNRRRIRRSCGARNRFRPASASGRGRFGQRTVAR